MAVPACFNTEVYAQAGQKFASGGNTLTTGEFLGTLNNFPLNIKINNTLRSSFTTTGFDLYGNLKVTKHATIDSILNTWQAVVKDALTVGTTLSVVGNATFNKNVTVTTGIFKAGLISITSNSITSNIGSISFGAGNLTTTGTISASNITTMQTSINNQQLAIGNMQTDVDTLENKMNNVQSSISNQQLAISNLQTEVGNQQNSIGNVQLAINNHDSILTNHQSSITGIQNQVLAMQPSQWQNDSSGNGNISYSGGNVGIGTANPSFPLEVSGSIKVTGATSGNNNNGGTPPTSQSIIIDGGIDQITATSGTLSLGSTNLTTTGNFQAAAISTGNLTISDNFSTRTITADTIRTANWGEYVRFDSPVRYREPVYMEKMMTATNMQIDTMTVTNQFTATNSVSSDTLVAVKQLNVNHNLALGSDSGSTESDIASRVKELSIQSDPLATYNVVMSADNNTRVGIGDKNPTEKLSVQGNVKVSGDILSAGNISANNLSIANNFVTNKIVTTRITSPDSVIAFGDSTVLLNTVFHRLYVSDAATAGITIGNARLNTTGFGALSQFLSQSALGKNSIAIGYNIRVSPSANNAIVLGSGLQAGAFTGTQSGYLENQKANSLMIGFNTSGNLPTLFVGPADGTPNSLGNVGIGTSNPTERLHLQNGSIYVDGEGQGVIVNQGGHKRVGLMKYSGREAGIWRVANQDFEIGRLDVSILPGTPTAFNTDIYIAGNGNVGIGTTTIPDGYKLAVYGNIIAEDIFVQVHSKWPDFIFEPEHDRMSFDEQKTFYKKNKHLFGIEPAKEIEKNGLGMVKTMQGFVLNLEETRLDVIDLYEMIKELKQENQLLKKEIGEMKRK